MRKLSGNILLAPDEMKYLRSGVMTTYSIHTGMPLKEVEKLFNSNLNNYDGLIKNINESRQGFPENIKGNKPLALLMHFSKNLSEGKAFRNTFIDTLYQYAYGYDREEYRRNRLISVSKAEDILEKLSGYWLCYYYEQDIQKESFVSAITEKGEAILSVLAISIDTDRKIQFYQTDECFGEGSVKIIDSNIIIQLQNSITLEPISIFLNSTRTIKYPIHEPADAAGIILQITQQGNPMAARCLLLNLGNAVDLRNKAMTAKFYPHEKIYAVDPPYLNTLNKKAVSVIRFFGSSNNSFLVTLQDFNGQSPNLQIGQNLKEKEEIEKVLRGIWEKRKFLK